MFFILDINYPRKSETLEDFYCGDCFSGFLEFADYQRHMHYHQQIQNQLLLNHSIEKHFGCDQCEKSFAAKSKLKRHMLYHSGEKPFGCDYCKKRFFENNALIRHLKRHAGEKRYACDQCDKRFSVKCNLNRHILTHSKREIFSCND